LVGVFTLDEVAIVSYLEPPLDIVCFPLKLTRIIQLKQRINMSHKFHLFLKEFIPTFKHLNYQTLVVMYAPILLSLRRKLFMSLSTP
jgi:hypothetical protein